MFELEKIYFVFDQTIDTNVENISYDQEKKGKINDEMGDEGEKRKKEEKLVHLLWLWR